MGDPLAHAPRLQELHRLTIERDRAKEALDEVLAREKRLEAEYNAIRDREAAIVELLRQAYRPLWEAHRHTPQERRTPAEEIRLAARALGVRL